MSMSVQQAPTFPFQRSDPFEPPSEYQALLADRPVSRISLGDGQPAWLVTRYQDVRAIVTDTRVSADPSRPGFPSHGPAGEFMARPGYFIFMDPPEHDVLRRMLSREFVVSRVEALRPKVQELVDELLDAMLDGPAPTDLVEAFALPLPSLVVCHMLGVPYDDHEFFQERAKTMVHATSADEARQAIIDLEHFLDRLVAAKEDKPADDLISRLVVDHVRTGALRHEELVGIANVLLVAGHETTGNAISLGTLALLQHPAQFAALRDDPGLVRSAAEELLRYVNIIETIHRVALEDIEVGGETIRAGEGIVASIAAGSRDEAVFTAPDRLDVTRRIRYNGAFGHGVHVCLGAPLARVELQAAYSTLARRTPTLRLAVPFEEVPFKHHGPYGLWALPVAW